MIGGPSFLASYEKVERSVASVWAKVLSSATSVRVSDEAASETFFSPRVSL